MMPRRPMHTFKPNRLASGIRSARGITLLELLLGLGAASVIATGAFIVFQPTDVRAEVQQTQFALADTATRIERSLGLTGNYASLDNHLVTGDRLMADGLYRNGRLENAWGGSTTFNPFTVRMPSDAFQAQLRDVPKAACVPLVTALANNVWDARVGSESVFVGGSFDPATAVSACQRLGGDDVSFVFYSGLVSGAAVATLPPTLPTAPPSFDPANPTTPTGPVIGAPSVGDASPGTPVTVAPGASAPLPPVVPGAPAPAPVTPGHGVGIPPTLPSNPPALSRCTPPGPDHQDVAACPAGTWGMVQQTRTWTCQEAWGSAEAGPWANAGSTCVACPGTETETSTQWVGASQACPTGQAGAHTWEAEQVATRQRSYNCPAGTTAAPGPTYGGWSAWGFTGNRRNESNSCVTVAPVLTLDATCSFTGAQTNQGPEVWNGGCIQPGQFYMRTSPVSAVFWLRSSFDLSQYTIEWSGDCVGNAVSCTAEQVRVSVNSPHDKTATVTVTHRATGQQFTKTVTAQWRVQGIDKGGGGN